MKKFTISFFILFWTEYHSIKADRNITFWQITDIHYDKFYMYHGNKAKNCHGENGTAEIFGDYSCEAGKDLFISSVKAMAEIKSDPDFILWTGRKHLIAFET